MISLVTALCLLGISMVSSDGNYTMPNYFVDAYQGNTAYYAYPMDICLQTGISISDNVIYTCSEDGTEVTKWFYNDDDCSQLQSNITYTVDDALDNGRYDFNCNGTTTYVELFVCVGVATCTGCYAGGSTYSVTGVCNYGGNGTSVLTTYGECDEDMATITAYPDSLTCNANQTNTTLLSATSECGYFTETTFLGSPIIIYAQVVSCVIDGVQLTKSPTVEPTMAPTDQPVEGGDDDDDDAAVSIEPLFSFVVVIGFANFAYLNQ